MDETSKKPNISCDVTNCVFNCDACRCNAEHIKIDNSVKDENAKCSTFTPKFNCDCGCMDKF